MRFRERACARVRPMMRAIGLACAVGLVISACAHPPHAASASPTPAERMQQADALVAAGCYDCLTRAVAMYEALRAEPAWRDAATDAAVGAAALVAIRENELGLVPGHYLDRARQLTSSDETTTRTVLEVAETIAAGPAGQTRAALTDAQLNATLTLTRNQQRWAETLRSRVPDDLASSYVWLSLACGPYGNSVANRDERRDVLGPAVETPLIRFKETTACIRNDAGGMRALLTSEPRFQELHYYLASAALAGIAADGSRVRPDVDEADRELRLAYEWRREWPSVTVAIGNVALTAEDFARAAEFYDRTLALSPAHVDALLGKIRALTYLGRADAAIAAADEMLAVGYNPGEARYWRAFNESRLRQDAEAWADIELAAQLLVNADVPKLAGAIALNRRELDVAQRRLELARTRNPGDCETQFYLQSVYSEQRLWQQAAETAASAAACFDAEETARRGEIAALQRTDMAAERRDRQIARREQQIAQNARMRANAWFNAAAAEFNRGHPDDARPYAEKVASDPQFGERAQELLRRLMP